MCFSLYHLGFGGVQGQNNKAGGFPIASFGFQGVLGEFRDEMMQ